MKNFGDKANKELIQRDGSWPVQLIQDILGPSRAPSGTFSLHIPFRGNYAKSSAPLVQESYKTPLSFTGLPTKCCAP